MNWTTQFAALARRKFSAKRTFDVFNVTPNLMTEGKWERILHTRRTELTDECL